MQWGQRGGERRWVDRCKWTKGRSKGREDKRSGVDRSRARVTRERRWVIRTVGRKADWQRIPVRSGYHTLRTEYIHVLSRWEHNWNLVQFSEVGSSQLVLVGDRQVFKGFQMPACNLALRTYNLGMFWASYWGKSRLTSALTAGKPRALNLKLHKLQSFSVQGSSSIQ